MRNVSNTISQLAPWIHFVGSTEADLPQIAEWVAAVEYSNRISNNNSR